MGAQTGDAIYVTGKLGDAALGLQCQLGKTDWSQQAVARFDRPEPRVACGQAIRTLATACIDVSDGLSADLGHILEASRVGATINVDDIPVSKALRDACPENAQAYPLILAGGDDYELCFCIAPENQAQLQADLKEFAYAITPIGVIEAEAGLRLQDESGNPVTADVSGFQHF